jgi:hypothetical protein
LVDICMALEAELGVSRLGYSQVCLWPTLYTAVPVRQTINGAFQARMVASLCEPLESWLALDEKAEKAGDEQGQVHDDEWFDINFEIFQGGRASGAVVELPFKALSAAALGQEDFAEPDEDVTLSRVARMVARGAASAASNPNQSSSHLYLEMFYERQFQLVDPFMYPDVAAIELGHQMMCNRFVADALKANPGKEHILPILTLALNCVASAVNSPAVVSMAIDNTHPSFLGKLVLHPDWNVATAASHALQQIIRLKPALIKPVIGALRAFLQLLPLTDCVSISTIMRQMALVIDLWGKEAVALVLAAAPGTMLPPNPLTDVLPLLMDVEAVSLVQLCHVQPSVRSDAWFLMDTVRRLELYVNERYLAATTLNEATRQAAAGFQVRWAHTPHS